MRIEDQLQCATEMASSWGEQMAEFQITFLPSPSPCSHALSSWRNRARSWNRRCVPWTLVQLQEFVTDSSDLTRRFPPHSLFSVTRGVVAGTTSRGPAKEYQNSVSSLAHCWTCVPMAGLLRTWMWYYPGTLLYAYGRVDLTVRRQDTSGIPEGHVMWS